MESVQNPARQTLQSNQDLTKPWPPSSPTQELLCFSPPWTHPDQSFSPVDLSQPHFPLCAKRGQEFDLQILFRFLIENWAFWAAPCFTRVSPPSTVHSLLHLICTRKGAACLVLGMQWRCLDCNICHGHIHFSDLPWSWSPNIHVKHPHAHHPAAVVL